MEQLKSNMSEHLRLKLRPITIPKKIHIGSKEVDIPLLQWTKFIARYDNDLRFELKRAREIADNIHRNAKRQNIGSSSNTAGDRLPRPAGSTPKAGHLPLLTKNEIKLLNEHQGSKALEAKKKQNAKASSSTVCTAVVTTLPDYDDKLPVTAAAVNTVTPKRNLWQMADAAHG
ncbi:hypothetical protein EST38_g14366, partial [Candolleomyces aberdarensis]